MGELVPPPRHRHPKNSTTQRPTLDQAVGRSGQSWSRVCSMTSSFAPALRLQVKCNPLYSCFDVDLSVLSVVGGLHGRLALGDEKKLPSPTCTCAPTIFSVVPSTTQVQFTSYHVECFGTKIAMFSPRHAGRTGVLERPVRGASKPIWPREV